MRIRRLHLMAFGPFTDVTLQPDQGEYGLHLIYGANEAGKSSSLRALRQWLYGIPNVSSDNFIHPNANLRIGGVIEDDQGRQLEFIRRKGRVKTLRGPDDQEPVDAASLTRFLGGIDETAFKRRFGIDYEALREGGRSVPQEGGELGELLFSAGSGIVDLGRIQKDLLEQADQIFNPRARSRQVNGLLQQLKEAQREVREHRVPTERWVSLNDALTRADSERTELDKSLTTLRTNASRLERIEAAIPLVGQRRELIGQLAALADVPRLPEDFSSRRIEFITALDHERDSAGSAASEVEHLTADLATISIPELLLSHRTAVTHLKDLLGQHLKAQADRPVLLRERESLESEILQILDEIGQPGDLSAAGSLVISRTLRLRVESLVNRYHSLRAEQKGVDATVSRLQRQLEERQAALAALPQRFDTDSLQEVLQQCQQLGAIDDRQSSLAVSLARLQDEAENRLARLRLWHGELKDVESLPIPAQETVERFRAELSSAREKCEASRSRIQELTSELERDTSDRQALQSAESVPTEQQLIQIRQRRDEGWNLIRTSAADHTAVDHDDVTKFVEEFAAGGTLEDAFLASVVRADDVSDRLRREADRVLRLADLEARIESIRRRIASLREEQQHHQNQWDSLQRDWTAVWSDSGIDPLPPEDMGAWLNSLSEIRDLSESVREQKQEFDRTKRQIQTWRDRLQKALSEETTQTSEDGELQPLLQVGLRTAEAGIRANRDRAQLESDCDRISDALLEARSEQAATLADQDEWQREWDDAARELRVADGSSPANATVMLQQLEELRNRLQERERLSKRISNIDEEFADFESSARDLCTAVATDLLDLPVSRAVQDLHDRLATAEKQRVRRDGLQRQFDEASLRQQQAMKRISMIEEQLDTLCAAAGVELVSDLSSVETAAAQRNDLERQVEQINARLTELAAGTPLEEFAESVAENDIDQITAERNRLIDDIRLRENERQHLSESVGSHQQELREIDGQSRAAHFQEQVELLSSELRDASEQYVRLHTASVVLRQAIEKYREESQGPVLERASQLFAELTLESFSGLRAEYNEKGDAVIAGVRRGSGQLVHVDGMSEGTCDQLYLAVRLALLEKSLETGRKMPLILDDVLIMFDDDRTVAALNVLAELSASTQVIFFTHHEHLLELAQLNISEDRLFVHYLDQSR